jgi:putative ATPase
MAKMIYAGESPRFIFRRMLIFASEDVGLADPTAIQVVVACANAFEQVGLPEGRFHLAHAALYLATAQKSNTTLAFFDALSTVEREADSGVPAHLRDASRDQEGFGHGEGYLYPHAYRDHWVAQQYLPASLQGKVFYEPSDQGYEANIRTTVARRREAQLAAMLEAENSSAQAEMLTFSPRDLAAERWLQRTISGAGERLGRLRDRVLDAARLVRHSRVLDLKAGNGLLIWEALRRAPEGGVYALAQSAHDAEALRQLAQRLPAVERPIIWQGGVKDLSKLLTDEDGVRFDAIVGYNALIECVDKADAAQLLRHLLAEGGVVSLAERIPRHTQRLYQLVALADLGPHLVERIIQGEEAIYRQADDPLVNWDVPELKMWWEEAGFALQTEVDEEKSELQVTMSMIDRWFTPSTTDRPSYAQHLAALLSQAEIARVRDLFQRQLLNQMITWRSRLVHLAAKPAR